MTTPLTDERVRELLVLCRKPHGGDFWNDVCVALSELLSLRDYIEQRHNGYGETGKALGMRRPATHLDALRGLCEEDESLAAHEVAELEKQLAALRDEVKRLREAPASEEINAWRTAIWEAWYPHFKASCLPMGPVDYLLSQATNMMTRAAAAPASDSNLREAAQRALEWFDSEEPDAAAMEGLRAALAAAPESVPVGDVVAPEPWPATGLEPRGCPIPGACSCPPTTSNDAKLLMLRGKIVLLMSTGFLHVKSSKEIIAEIDRMLAAPPPQAAAPELAQDFARYPVPPHRCHVMVKNQDTGQPGPCYAMHPCGKHDAELQSLKGVLVIERPQAAAPQPAPPADEKALAELAECREHLRNMHHPDDLYTDQIASLNGAVAWLLEQRLKEAT